MTPTLRIVHVVNDAETGGAQTLIEALSSSPEGGDEHHVLVLMGRGALSDRLAASASTVTYAHLGRRSLSPFRAIRALRGLVREHDVDIVHSHLLQSDLVSLLTFHRTARVTTLHTSGAHESRSLSQLVGLAVARLSRKFDAVVACSSSAREYGIRSRYAQGTAIPVIHNGTHVPPRRPDSEPSREGPVRLVHLARWHPMKDHATLFASLAILQSAGQAVVVDCAGLGVESTNSTLVELAAEHGVSGRVRFLGSVADVPGLLTGAAGLIISSSHGEALPMAGLEALAHGLPVATTDVGDCRILAVDPRLVVPPRDPQQLANAIGVLSDAPEEWPDLSHEAWHRAASSFSVASCASAYRALYLRVTGRLESELV